MAGRKVVGVVLGTLSGFIVLAGVALGVMYSQFTQTALPGQKLENIELTGSESAVREQFRTWWEDYSSREVLLSSKNLKDGEIAVSLQDLDSSLNLDSEIKKVQFKQFFPNLLGQYNDLEVVEVEIVPEVKANSTELEEVAKFVKDHERELGKARASLEGEKIKLIYESAGVEPDFEKLPAAVLSALEGNNKGELPLKQGEKHVADKELDRIQEVMGTFSTTFSAGNISRSTNIRLAASRINGLVLLPGETFSFNGHLGQRTTAKGFKVAGVYVSGRHDFDVGGGICQVSTTLYNASLQSGLKISSRSPHSLPVPYVPLGRDAAVSFPNPDLKLTNPYDFPIALAAIPGKSSIKFSILGEKKTGRTYKFESQVVSTWSRGEKIVHDPSLPYGKRKIVDRGGSGRKVRTWKLIYEDGKLVEKKDLGYSTYSGGPVIVAMNRSAKKPVAAPAGDSTPVALPESETN